MGISNKSLEIEYVLIFFLVLAIFICVISLYKLHIQKKRIIQLTESMDHFRMYPNDSQKLSLDEGYLANLYNQVAELEKLFLNKCEFVDTREKEVIEFVENMAHQIKNVITAIQIQLDILSLNKTNEQVESLNKCQDCIDRLCYEVERILKTSQIAAKKIKMADDKINIYQLIEESVKHLYSIAEKRNISIVLPTEFDVEYIGDYFWLSQAIENVIKNAVEHTRDNGVVVVSVVDEKRIIKIIVEDQGPGVSEEEMKYLFRRFHRGNKNKAGYGIGLSMTKDIVEAHHGSINVKNNTKEGAIFQIELLSLDGKDMY